MKFWEGHVSRPQRRERSFRHEFVLGPVCDSSLFRRKARLYYCVRCKWRFLVCENRVSVLDQYGKPLPAADSTKRFNTFEEGPCPALTALKTHSPIKAYIVYLRSGSKCDEPRNLATGNIPVGSSESRSVFRVPGGVRKNLGRQP